MKLKQGSKLQNGKYRIIRVLGQGGFGITYLAKHSLLDKLVAIKEFFPKEYCDRDETTSHVTIGTKNSVELVAQLKTKFIKEAKNISKLHHPNIITIHDVFQENNTAYYVMEYVEGISLAEQLKRYGVLKETDAVRYIGKVADAVSYMHSLSMNHLDLKPANIMLRESDDEPILIDFGLSKQYDASGGQTSTTPIGISHGFAPIEQYCPGGVATFTPQTDIYALGATLYNLLSGNVPPHYSELLEDGLPELPTNVSAKTITAIHHAMEVKKIKRPASVAEFLGELSTDALTNKNIQDGKNIQNKKTPQSTSKNSFSRQHAFVKENKTESTMMIGDFANLSNAGASAPPISIDDIDFIDLGLSVKWANCNIGAEVENPAGKFFAKRMDGNLNDLYQWNTRGAIVPSINNFKELLTKCHWIWEEQKGTRGYKIVGRNGNKIFFPVTGDGNKYPGKYFETFGLLWTNEALLNEWQTDSLLLYFNASAYQLTSYSTNKICPIRLVLMK